jgi:hypothetical protein
MLLSTLEVLCKAILSKMQAMLRGGRAQKPGYARGSLSCIQRNPSSSFQSVQPRAL